MCYKEKNFWENEAECNWADIIKSLNSSFLSKSLQTNKYKQKQNHLILSFWYATSIN